MKQQISIKRLSIAFIFIYIGLLIFAYYFSDIVIFPAPEAQYKDSDYDIIKLKTVDGETLSAVYLTNPDATFTILYNHGNGEDIGMFYFRLQEFAAQGFNVFAYDYRGYGTSTGQPTEQGVYQDAQTAYDYLINTLHTPPEKMIAYGFSLGGGVATELASQNTVGALILESTFVTIFRVRTHVSIVPFDKFRNIDKIKNVNCPVLVIHGTDDRILPFWHGQALWEQAQIPKLSLWVEKADHGDSSWVAGDDFWKSIKKLVSHITLKNN